MAYFPAPSITTRIDSKSKPFSKRYRDLSVKDDCLPLEEPNPPVEKRKVFGRPKVKSVPELNLKVDTKVAAYFRREYLKKLSGHKISGNYSLEEIANRLERKHLKSKYLNGRLISKN